MRPLIRIARGTPRGVGHPAAQRASTAPSSAEAVAAGTKISLEIDHFFASPQKLKVDAQLTLFFLSLFIDDRYLSEFFVARVRKQDNPRLPARGCCGLISCRHLHIFMFSTSLPCACQLALPLRHEGALRVLVLSCEGLSRRNDSLVTCRFVKFPRARRSPSSKLFPRVFSRDVAANALRAPAFAKDVRTSK